MRRRALALVVTLGLGAGVPASASTDSDLARLRAELDETAAAEADLLADYQATQRRRAQLDARIAELDGEIAATQAAVAAAEARLAELELQLRVTDGVLAVARRNVAVARDELAAQAVAAYVDNGWVPELQLVLARAGSFESLGATTSYANVLVERQRQAIARFEQREAEVQQQLAAMEADRAAVSAQRDEVARRTAELVAARAAQADARAQVAQELAREQALIAQVRAKRSEYEARIAAIEAESQTIAGLLRRRQAGQGAWRGSLRAPVPGPIGSSFGWRVHPIFGTRKLHAGVDYSAASGDPIRAAADGVVVWAGERSGYGRTTIIDHGGRVATLYAHQSRIGVRLGQRVSRGEVIGAVGATGYATGPHLHFEVRVFGDPVNPRSYL